RLGAVETVAADDDVAGHLHVHEDDGPAAVLLDMDEYVLGPAVHLHDAGALGLSLEHPEIAGVLDGFLALVESAAVIGPGFEYGKAADAAVEAARGGLHFGEFGHAPMMPERARGGKCFSVRVHARAPLRPMSVGLSASHHIHGDEIRIEVEG